MKKPIELVEERWNAYSHALGIVLGILGTVTLLAKQHEAHHFWPILIYGVSVILLFSASTAYHVAKNPAIKKRLRVLDHISIYYLIAGTYTPVCLWVLKGSKGVLLLCLVWGVALLGTFFKLFFTGKFEVFSLLLYGVMGWLIIIDITYLIENISKTAILYLALGGACYTLGMLFYAAKRIPFNHLIWHFFVLCGAIGHWFMVLEITYYNQMK